MPLLRIRGDHIRMTGLRLRGADTETRGSAYELPVAGGVDTESEEASGRRGGSNHLEVDNCELWGWSHAAVFLAGRGHHVHHNHIHHCRREGLGYGVCLSHEPTDCLIEANRFDHNRHDIAATGSPGNAYEACYNISAGGGTAHAFDMHGGRYCHENRFEEERMTKYDFTFPESYDRRNYLLDRPNVVDGEEVEAAR
ncbi:MAG: hypothetical protein JXP34_20875 [Planctomycetes bacterium]|nr:hypothetical protein [Planctomycetota bacterium]